MTPILAATAIMAGLGLLFGVALALAARFFEVDEDPRIDQVEAMLPGSNCGACGEPGCRALAEKLVTGAAAPGKCTVSSAAGIEAIADFLGVEAGGDEKRVARVHCGGGLGRARQLASYQGFDSCRAAHLVGGGGLECSWGCLGLADCVRSCTFDAMHMNAWLLPVVDVDACTACGDCVEACPRDLIDLMPLSQRLIVQCVAPLAADEARRLCTAACDACGRCAMDAAPGLIRMERNLPVIDWESGAEADPGATWRCPTGAIQWVEGEQFRADAATAARSAHA
ncbi:MAG TPA: RnfABCDGE type electron transport complex subunit B [Thermoanaerobaculia bacterium]|nr:RnfABCDGE type electron transport complex subunit B [Thermoanaerobaculia bacterium]